MFLVGKHSVAQIDDHLPIPYFIRSNLRISTSCGNHPGDKAKFQSDLQELTCIPLLVYTDIKKLIYLNYLKTRLNLNELKLFENFCEFTKI